MGWRAMPELSARLIDAGLDADTPAAAIERASMPEQRSVTSTLAELPTLAAAAGLRPPVTLVIGPVVELGEGLSWRESRPLHGRRIVVTRPAHSAAGFAGVLRAQGAIPLVMPAIELCDAETAPIRGAIEWLRRGSYDDVVFTSVNGVQRFHGQLREAGGDARAYGGVRLAAIGPATSAALERVGLRPDIVPDRYTSAALLDALLSGSVRGRRVLLPRAAQGSPALSDGLRDAGAQVDDIAVYDVRTASPVEAVLQQLRDGEVDTITFTAPSTVHGLVEQAGTELLQETEVASIGPVTTAAASAAGITVTIEAAVHTMEGLVDAIIQARRERSARA